MRKTIGPAYEQCPADRLTRWVSENILKLISAIIVAIIFCFVVDWLVDGLFNFLATDGKDDVQSGFTSSSPVVDAVKVFGSIVLIFLICKNRAK